MYFRDAVTPKEMAKNRWGATTFRVTATFCASGNTPLFTQPPTKKAALFYLTSDQNSLSDRKGGSRVSPIRAPI